MKYRLSQILKLLAIAAIVLIAVLLVRHFWKSDEQRIRERFQTLEKLISKGHDEGNIEGAVKFQGIGDLFAPESHLTIQGHALTGVYTPEEIASHAARARARFAHLTLRFHDLDIEIRAENRALVLCTVQLRGQIRDGEGVNEVRELQCHLEKFEDKWRFTEFTAVEVLRR